MSTGSGILKVLLVGQQKGILSHPIEIRNIDGNTLDKHLQLVLLLSVK